MNVIESLQSLDPDDGAIHGVAFSTDGEILAVSGYRFVSLFETKTARRLHRLAGHGDEVRGVAFSPDGKLLASASGPYRHYPTANAAPIRPIAFPDATIPQTRSTPRSFIFHEQVMGWNAYLSRSKNSASVVRGYERLGRMLAGRAITTN